jgi:hypothetical protein
MLMADTLAIFFVILGLMLAFPGLWLLCRGLWPRLVEDATARCHQGLLKLFLTGLPLTVLMVLGAVVLSKIPGPLGKILAATAVCLYLVFAHIGVAGLATCIGQRLASSADSAQPWRATLRGGIILELPYLLPILGWFGLLPISIIIGCGAATLSLLSMKSIEIVVGPRKAEELPRRGGFVTPESTSHQTDAKTVSGA